MKILLARLEDPTQHQLYPPFGLMYVQSALNLAGYETEIFHKRATEENIKRIVQKGKKSSFVSFSLMTSPSLYYTLKASEELKKEGIPIVWGGVHPTLLPTVSLKEPSVDFVVLGEGEETVISLAKHIEKGTALKSIDGIGYKENGNLVIRHPKKFMEDIDRYRLSWGSLNIKDYLQTRFGHDKIIPLITSRGCPHRCTFCYNLPVHQRRWRCHSKEYVIGQIEELKKHGINGISFFDDNFFTDRKRAFSLLKDINLPWLAEVRADYINEDFIKNVKSLNGEALSIGAESGSDRVLREILQKDITTQQIENAVRLCDEYGIRNELSFMIGLPGETNEERKETLLFMYRLYKKYKKVSFWGPKVYTPYPGTPLYETAIRHGFNPPKTSLEWGKNFFRYKCNLPWIKNKNELELLYIMIGLAQTKSGLFSLIKKFEERRWENINLKLPLELVIAKKLSKNPILTKLFFNLFKA